MIKNVQKYDKNMTITWQKCDKNITIIKTKLLILLLVNQFVCL